MEELRRPDCAANQVLYNPDHRGIEHDLLPWCARHSVPVMRIHRWARWQAPAESNAGRNCRPASSDTRGRWRSRGLCANLKSSSYPRLVNLDHVRENSAAIDLHLKPEDFCRHGSRLPASQGKKSLAML